MCAAKNYHRIARPFTPFGPVTLGPAADGPTTSPITLDESDSPIILDEADSPIPAQVVGNQTQAATDVLQVTEELQGLTLGSSVQGIEFGTYQAAAGATPMFVD